MRLSCPGVRCFLGGKGSDGGFLHFYNDFWPYEVSWHTSLSDHINTIFSPLSKSSVSILLIFRADI